MNHLTIRNPRAELAVTCKHAFHVAANYPRSSLPVASTSRLGLSEGFTPREAMMSATVRATTGLGLNLTDECNNVPTA